MDFGRASLSSAWEPEQKTGRALPVAGTICLDGKRVVVMLKALGCRERTARCTLSFPSRRDSHYENYSG